MAEKEVRKTTTKRVVRRMATKTVPARTSARQAGGASVRKAPTRVATSSGPRRSSKAIIVGILVFSVLFGVSALIGFSDKGQLNVETIIAERKQNASPEEKVSLETVPVQQSNSAVPNGGLVGMGQSELPPPPVVEATSSATTTASTTPVAEESNNSSDTTTEESTTEDTEVRETPSDVVAQ